MSYYVVALEHGDPLLEKSKFHYLGCALVDESKDRIRAELRRTGDASFLKSLGNVKVYARLRAHAARVGEVLHADA